MLACSLVLFIESGFSAPRKYLIKTVRTPEYNEEISPNLNPQGKEGVKGDDYFLGLLPGIIGVVPKMLPGLINAGTKIAPHIPQLIDGAFKIAESQIAQAQ
ncbi:uncharacterized protein LOC111703182 [Eurytemora carolleeae]|uniref:uncharacterized protein LOC111703182 n=1 Tax=Eurytemora carolleeae TaxID=1294199 RepID=UPI000C7906BA|nr:uncharacterized protein LOC111703182 [Eurytemora carolleeae]|eukprot:XP_023330826.1 uncharacterized protein LOC111703182 [Eurytemora affinis]